MLCLKCLSSHLDQDHVFLICLRGGNPKKHDAAILVPTIGGGAKNSHIVYVQPPMSLKNSSRESMLYFKIEIINLEALLENGKAFKVSYSCLCNS